MKMMIINFTFALNRDLQQINVKATYDSKCPKQLAQIVM